MISTDIDHGLRDGLDEWAEDYRRLLNEADKVIKGDLLASELIDSGAVAATSEKIGRNSFYRVIKEELTKVQGNRLLTLGAGKAEIGSCFVQMSPTNTAIAVERSTQAVEMARVKAKRMGIQDRLIVKQMDAAEILATEPKLVDGANLVEAGFVLHDVLAARGEKFTINLLQEIASRMNPDGSILICEAVRAGLNSHSFSKLFTVVHQIQGINLPTKSGWCRIFMAAHLNIEKCIYSGMPGGWLFVLKSTHGRRSLSVPMYKRLPGHDKEVPFYIGPFAGSDASVVAIDLGDLANSGPAKPHKHKGPEYYILPKYSEPVFIKVIIDGEEAVTLKSPATFMVPADTIHSFEIIAAKAGQHIIGVFPEGV